MAAKAKSLIIFLAVLPLLFSCGSAGTKFYLDPSAAPGGDGSPKAPFATVQAAVEGLRAAREAGTLPVDKPVYLIFRQGNYVLTEGIKLTSDDSGTPGSPVIWKAAKGARACITGGIPVPVGLFGKVDDPSILRKLPEEARGKAYVADISGLVPGEIAELLPSFSGTPVGPIVFMGGRLASLARWPDKGYVDFENCVDHGDEGGTFGAFVCDDPRPSRWDFDSGVWLNGYWTADWANSSGRAAGFGEEKGVRNVLRLGASVGAIKRYTWGRDQRRFYAFNLIEELDAPGEWYLDRARKLLYIIPLNGEPLASDDITLATIKEPLVSADGTGFFTIDGIDFQYGYGDGLYLKGNDVTIENCRISCFGFTALNLIGDRNVARNLELCNLGRTGINIIGGDRMTLTKSESLVEDCDIHDYGFFFRCFSPGITPNGCGLTLRRNVIHDAPYSAVMYGGNEHLFEYNEVYNVLQEIGDGGAFYTGRDWTTQGNVLRYNYVHDIRSGVEYESNTMGFYFDDLDAGDEVYGNVFRNLCSGMMIGGGRDHPVYNNVFDNCEIAIAYDARGLRWPGYASWDEGTAADDLLKKAEAFDYKNGVWAEKYPRLAKIMDEDPLVPLYNPIDHNLFIDCTRFIIDVDTAIYPNLAKMAPIKDNLVVNTRGTDGVMTASIDKYIKDGFTVFDGTADNPIDVGFVDPEKGNYDLKKNSWVSRQLPGFKPIPKIVK